VVPNKSTVRDTQASLAHPIPFISKNSTLVSLGSVVVILEMDMKGAFSVHILRLLKFLAFSRETVNPPEA
jgi:hypothetical protein